MKCRHLLLLLALPFSVSLTACDSEEACETDNTGTLTIKNTRSSSITVDAKGNIQSIAVGKTGTFNYVPGGTCYIDVTYNGTKYIGVSLSTCVRACETTALQY